MLSEDAGSSFEQGEIFRRSDRKIFRGRPEVVLRKNWLGR